MDNISVSTTDVRIERHANQLSRQLKLLRDKLFPPLSQKTLRTFSSGEAAQMIGVSDGYLRQLSLDGKGAAAGAFPEWPALLYARPNQ
ncbi:hypothetical protein GGI59_002986 [Rhizobium lentis]|uniref:Plasmid partitioning protein RepA n=1 Tax=Rhizobium lentis TaxID=1138194 RepID=A0A7W8UNL0_9HYPH|nr:hypothetical protein [Rhizobium lentis]MBB5550567.1 hypothetical protein [Rhizobium lentis]MBB5561311.1 hypothetical protein [Rhizobium lentis]MBB5567686.1 hypothetical protein [Rhizobium lentis]